MKEHSLNIGTKTLSTVPNCITVIMSERTFPKHRDENNKGWNVIVEKLNGNVVKEHSLNIGTKTFATIKNNVVAVISCCERTFPKHRDENLSIIYIYFYDIAGIVKEHSLNIGTKT